jgi:hypothetical protein
LLTDIQHHAHQRVDIADQDSPPPTLIIAVDQTEELFNPGGSREANHFLDLLGQYLGSLQSEPENESATGSRLRAIAIFSIRSDRYELLQTAPALANIETREFSLKPIPPAEFKGVIEGPSQTMTKVGRKLDIDPKLSERLLAVFSSGADVLPLLALTLERLYVKYGTDGDLRLHEYQALIGIKPIVEVAVELALSNPREPPEIPADRDEQLLLLRRAFIPWLAHINEDSNQPMRQIASMADLPAEAHPLIERLINLRLLVRDRQGDHDMVEVAHESLMRQWATLRSWLDAEADNLKAADGVARAAFEWQRHDKKEHWLDHRAERLVTAEQLLQRQDFAKKLGANGTGYLKACRIADNKRHDDELARERALREAAEAKEQEAKARAGAAAREKEQARRVTRVAMASTVVVGLVAAFVTWLWWEEKTVEHGLAKVLTPLHYYHIEPEMVKIPAGSFRMGDLQRTGDTDEKPIRKVEFQRPFAIGKYEVTFAEYERYLYAQGIKERNFVSDQGWGRDRGRQPVIDVLREDAVSYASWLSKQTGKRYRLPTEAEWEYAARGGTASTWFWSDRVSMPMCSTEGMR